MHSPIHRECEMKSYGSGRVLVTSGRNNGTWHIPNLMLHRSSEDKKRIRVVVALIDGQRSRCCCKTINLKYASLARTLLGFRIFRNDSAMHSVHGIRSNRSSHSILPSPLNFSRRIFFFWLMKFCSPKRSEKNETNCRHQIYPEAALALVLTFAHSSITKINMSKCMRNVWAAFGCCAKSCEFRELYDLARSWSDFTHKRCCWCVCLV